MSGNENYLKLKVVFLCKNICLPTPNAYFILGKIQGISDVQPLSVVEKIVHVYQTDNKIFI